MMVDCGKKINFGASRTFDLTMRANGIATNATVGCGFPVFTGYVSWMSLQMGMREREREFGFTDTSM